MPPSRNRELRFVLSADERDFHRGLERVDRQLDATDTRARRFTQGIGDLAKASGAAALVVGGSLLYEAKRATDAFEESAKVAEQTNAVIKSTGGVAGETAESVARLASELARKTGVDDEAIQSGENVLLTFTKVRNEVGKGNDVFDQATRLALDMSVALGTSLHGASLQVGKALQDPVRGITALRRAGVSFTEDQQKQIKTLVDSGRQLDAQRIILRELRTEFTGSAEAQARPLERMKVAVENVEEAIGRGLSPVISTGAEEIERFARRAEPAINQIAEDIEDVFGRRDIDIATKFRISSESARENLQPFAEELGDVIERAHLADHLEDALVDAAPMIAEQASRIGVRAVGAFAHAWMSSDVLTRALLGGWLLAKTGAFGAFRRMGALQGAQAAAGYNAAFAAGTATTGIVGGPRGRGVGGGIRGIGGALLRPGPQALIGAALIAGPELLKPFSRDSEGANRARLDKRAQDLVNQAREEGAGSIIRYTRALKRLADEERNARDAGGDFRREQNKTANALEKTANDSVEIYIQQIDRMARSTDRSMKSIRDETRRTAAGIRRNLGKDTEEGKELLAANFRAAAQAVKARMREAGHDTRAGVAEMNGYIRKALAVYGITGKQASNYIQGRDTIRGTGLGNDPDTGIGPNKAVGGWIGQRGQRGGDEIPIMVGAGEAVLNRHQQAVVEGYLGDGFLDDLFSRVQTPHFMARGGRIRGYQRGGIVPVPGFPGERAASSILDEIAMVSRTYGLRLTDAYGSGHKSPGHTVFGTAADFSGPDAAMDRAVQALVAAGYLVGYDGRFGSQRWPGHGPTTVAGANAHLHVEFGTRGGQLQIAAPTVGRVRFPGGMGALSALGQAGMNAMHAAGQDIVSAAATSALGMPVGGGGDGHAGGMNRAQLAQLWVRAGGDPSRARLMAAIALAESGGSPTARNPSGASGLWQILGLPFAGDPFDPMTNARMAVWKYEHQGLGAWEAYTRGMHRQYLAGGGRVRGAHAARGRRPGLAGRRGHGVVGRGAGPGPALTRARQDLAITRAGENPAKLTKALNARRSSVVARIRQVRQALGGHGISRGRRLTLTRELNDLIVERRDLDDQITEANRSPEPADVAEPGTLPAGYSDAISLLDLQAGAGLLDDPATADVDETDSVLARRRVELADRALGGEFGALDERAQLQVMADRRGAQADVKSLEDAIREQTAATTAHTEEIKALKDEVKRNTDFAEGVAGVTGRQALAALADVLSGEIVGRRYQGRSQSAGSGVATHY